MERITYERYEELCSDWEVFSELAYLNQGDRVLIALGVTQGDGRSYVLVETHEREGCRIEHGDERILNPVGDPGGKFWLIDAADKDLAKAYLMAFAANFLSGIEVSW